MPQPSRLIYYIKVVIKKNVLTTTRFHILAASATVVHTVLQPANSINFWGLLYNKLYITDAPRPGSHWENI